MKDHYEGMKEWNRGEGGLIKTTLRTVAPQDVPPCYCLTCGGNGDIKFQSGFGDVDYYSCGDCGGTGLRSDYDRITAARRKANWKISLICLICLAIFALLAYWAYCYDMRGLQ